MGKSQRPNSATISGECKKCHQRTRSLCSNGECSLCNPTRYQKEFPSEKGSAGVAQ